MSQLLVCWSLTSYRLLFALDCASYLPFLPVLWTQSSSFISCSSAQDTSWLQDCTCCRIHLMFSKALPQISKLGWPWIRWPSLSAWSCRASGSSTSYWAQYCWDIWSCGIILYAMSCGYLPFEDPNTSKLYKKILNCDYLLPGFISKPSKDLIRKILNTDPQKRYNVTDIRNHEWYSTIKSQDMDGIIIGKDRVPVLEEFLGKIQDCFATSGITPNCDLNQTVTYIQNNKHNQITSTYYLLIKKK